MARSVSLGRMRRRRVVWWILLGVVLLALLGRACDGGDERAERSAAPTEQTETERPAPELTGAERHAAEEAAMAARHAAEEAEERAAVAARRAAVRAAEAERRAAEAARRAAVAASRAAEEAEERRKGFHCLSALDDTHWGFNDLIRARLDDPRSFQHDTTSIAPVAEGRHRIVVDFRAPNAFGEVVRSRAYGWVTQATCNATLTEIE